MAELKDLRTESLFNVKGWVAIVTGGGTGLGLMTANALAANGCKVYITGRRVEKLKNAELQDSTSGGSITAIQTDVTDRESIKSLVKTISEKEKCVNLLVNNAGATSVNYGEQWTPQGDPKEVSERMLSYQDFDDWTSIYKINVASIYFTSIAFLPLLCAARDHGYPEAGNIINISSISGITKESQWGQFRYGNT
jgi:NAD(P)-dependent dehydrogenase (short-subunit alcohol dehydrogenase family)